MKKALFVLLISAAAVWSGACHNKPAVPAAPPSAATPAVVSPPPVPVPSTWPELPLPPTRLPAPPEPPLPKYFREAEGAFKNGDYKSAILNYSRFVREDPVKQNKDVALFRLGMSYLLDCARPDCRAKAIENSQAQFRRLIAEYPRSPYSMEARSISGLQADIEKMSADVKSRDETIKKLTDELERLKKIDLERQPPRIKK